MKSTIHYVRSIATTLENLQALMNETMDMAKAEALSNIVWRTNNFSRIDNIKTAEIGDLSKHYCENFDNAARIEELEMLAWDCYLLIEKIGKQLRKIADENDYEDNLYCYDDILTFASYLEASEAA